MALRPLDTSGHRSFSQDQSPRLRPSLPKWTQQPPPGFHQSAGGELGTAPKTMGTQSSAAEGQSNTSAPQTDPLPSSLPPNLLFPAS